MLILIFMKRKYFTIVKCSFYQSVAKNSKFNNIFWASDHINWLFVKNFGKFFMKVRMVLNAFISFTNQLIKKSTSLNQFLNQFLNQSLRPTFLYFFELWPLFKKFDFAFELSKFEVIMKKSVVHYFDFFGVNRICMQLR